MEVLTGPERRRRWTADQKLVIARELPRIETVNEHFGKIHHPWRLGCAAVQARFVFVASSKQISMSNDRLTMHARVESSRISMVRSDHPTDPLVDSRALVATVDAVDKEQPDAIQVALPVGGNSGWMGHP